MFLEQANLLKKISFPRICLPVIVVLNSLVNFGIIFGLFTVFLIVSGNFPGVVYLAIVPLLVLQVLLAIGLAMITGRAERVLPRRRPVLHDRDAVLVLAHADRLPGLDPAAEVSVRCSTTTRWRRSSSPTRRSWSKARCRTGIACCCRRVLALLLCVLGMHLFRKRAGEMVDEL